MNDGVLLDTCAMIWLAENEPLEEEGHAAIAEAEKNENIYVSPISAWETALLVSRQRIALSLPVDRWFEAFLSMKGSLLAEMPPRVLIDSVCLPGDPPDDPADRILAATSREYDLTLITRDKALLAYGAKGHIHALRC